MLASEQERRLSPEEALITLNYRTEIFSLQVEHELHLQSPIFIQAVRFSGLNAVFISHID